MLFGSFKTVIRIPAMMRFCILLLFLSVISAKDMQTCGPDRSVDFEGLQCTDKYYHKLCVAPRKAETYFTYHIVQPFLKNAGADCNEEWKSCVYIYQSEEGAYNVDKQFEHFAVLRFNQISIKKRRYFVHHNFVPCADIGNQNCTCYVEQSAPAFVAVKEGNLKRVENFIRKAIVNPTEVITGQFGQLKLLNSRNVLSEMYLENIKDSGAELLSTLTTISKISRDISGDELGSSSFDSNRHRNSEKKKQQEAALNAARGLQPLNKLNVPEIFYKLIRDTVTNEGMVILTSNNPFLDKMESSPLNMMCRENLCEFTTNLQKSVDGYTYCCDVEEFTNNLRSLYRIAFDGIIDYRSVKRPSDIRGMLIRGGLLEG